ncbi:substrate-binding domain-containing protein [Limisalsivibrio acetivorans]|uniref:substrate-binding domain-containing protein n=1 Tax=Limisalsivibrio acetivorans TaxID=1304888 RepID=UPI0003B6DE12|nr:substrate-binding domain-containing protein [Limisalsivibrio acetivorans]
MLRRFLLTITLLMFALSAYARTYWTIPEYFSIHPEQAALFDRFSEQVRLPGIPMERTNIKPVRIAVVYPALQSSEYWLRSVSSFEARLRELRVNYDLFTYYSRPSGDIRLQAKQIAEAVKRDVDYLVVSADDPQIRKLLSRILPREKPKVIIQNLTTPLREWQNYQPFIYVGFDHYTGSSILAGALRRMLPHDTKYSVLYGSMGSVSELRGGGFLEDYRHNGERNEPEELFYTGFSQKKSYNATKEILSKHPDTGLIFCCATDIAVGAAEAVSDAGLSGEVVVNGWGGGTVELKALMDGRITLTVMRMNDDNGVAMAEAVKMDIQGRGEEVPLIYSGDFSVLFSDDPAEKIMEKKIRAFRYSE